VALTDAMPSWNESKAKDAILTFVERVTTKGSHDFVAPSERIAVFDNDGTLWAEQPMYVQLAFAIDRVRALASRHPEWKTNEPFASLLDGDVRRALTGGERTAAEIVAVTHAGMTADEFQGSVREWRRTARHPTLNRRYTELVYQPMLELLRYLRANGFKTFIVTGGGVEFVRAWADDIYGIPPEQVVGSASKKQFELRSAGPVLVKLPDVDFVDDRAGKPASIQRFIGRQPIAAFGNSDGDHEMLQWTAAGKGPRLMLLVHHTDAEREWAYDRDSDVGRLDKALDEARAKGWAVASMKDDWKTIFANRNRFGTG
jgi:phosphoglycolate phosphatase-like HAD superfamily hydrolase